MTVDNYHLTVARIPSNEDENSLAKASAIKSGRRGFGSRAVGARGTRTLLVKAHSLAELTHEGLVRAIPYTGWVVATLTLKDARELCTVRAALEGLAARLAAEAISPENITALIVAYDRLVESARRANHRQCVENDLALHKTMFEMTSNDLLIGLYERIGQQIRMFVAFSDLRSDFDEFVTWHATLVKSIKDGDAAAAERIATENANRNGAELLAQLERNMAAHAGKDAAEPASPARRTRRGRE
jgi:DNA-binding GntR family transcriptional regulator